eukprot:5072860-Amphidinium_carterae.1
MAAGFTCSLIVLKAFLHHSGIHQSLERKDQRRGGQAALLDVDCRGSANTSVPVDDSTRLPSLNHVDGDIGLRGSGKRLDVDMRSSLQP